MTNSDVATPRRVTSDWVAEFPGFDVWRPMHLLSLFDVVRIDENDMLTEVISSGGHRTLRALIVPGLTDAEVAALADRVNSLAQREGFVREWSGDRHLAVNIPGGRDPDPLVALMSEQRAAGKLFWEWSDMKPFRTAGM